MAGNPVTPSHSGKNLGPDLLNSQKLTSIPGVRLVMEVNGMPIDDKAALEQNRQIVDHAREIVGRTRHSPIRPEWKGKLMDERDRYAQRNEVTWIVHFWRALQNPERYVRQRDEHGSLVEPEIWGAATWFQDGLDDNWDQPLNTGSLPTLEIDDANVLELLDSLPRVTTPKPDIAFGLRHDEFTQIEKVVNNRYHMYAGVSESILHPFFIVETKTRGTIEETENQCCRGGAALVCAARQMIHDSDPDASQDGPDIQSIAFSLALVPTLAHIFVHWAHIDTHGGLVYHMHYVTGFPLRNKDSLVDLFRAVNNILDWGTDERKTFIKGVLKKLHDLKEKEAGKGSEKQAEKGPSKRKRAKTAAGAKAQHSTVQDDEESDS